MQNTNDILIEFFNNEAQVGWCLNWTDYATQGKILARLLQEGCSVESVAEYFKNTKFEHKKDMLETLEQDYNRPDLARLFY